MLAVGLGMLLGGYTLMFWGWSLIGHQHLGLADVLIPGHYRGGPIGVHSTAISEQNQAAVSSQVQTSAPSATPLPGVRSGVTGAIPGAGPVGPLGIETGVPTSTFMPGA